ncbi:hypothetical protein D3C78_772190 [compost metagenome]
MGVIEQARHRQLVRRGIAIAAGAQTKIDHLRRWHRGLEFFAGPGRKRLGQSDENLPVVQRALGLGQDGPVEAADIAHGEHIERRIVVIVFQRRGRRQDQIGIARGLVDVQVDADHELQPVQRLFQLSTIGGRQHRVTGHGHQRTHLPLPFGEHLFGQRRHRQLTAVLRTPGHPALPLIEMPTRGRRHQIDSRLGAQCASDPIQVTGDQVDQLHQPMAQGTERLGGNAHATITNRSPGGGEIPGQLPNLPGRYRA